MPDRSDSSCGFLLPASGSVCTLTFTVHVRVRSDVRIREAWFTLEELKFPVPLTCIDEAVRRQQELSSDSAVFPWLISLPAGLTGLRSLRFCAEDESGRSIDSAIEIRIIDPATAHSSRLPLQPNAAVATDVMRATAFPSISICIRRGSDETLFNRSLRSIERLNYPSVDIHLLTDTSTLAARIRQAAATSEFSVFLDEGDWLEPGFLQAALPAMASCDLIYTDHDHTDLAFVRRDPWYTPGWSPDLLLSQNYVGGAYLIRNSLLLQTLDRCELSTETYRYEMLLQCIALTKKVTRVPHILWCANPVNTKSALHHEADAVVRWLEQEHPGAALVSDRCAIVRQIRWPLNKECRVSVIIPSTGNPAILGPCLRSLLARTEYKNFEVLLLDNSRGRFRDGIAMAADLGCQVIECDEAFNWSRLNNRGAQAANGELLLFLNDDIEITDPWWMSELVSLCQREDVGTAGGLLLYPGGAIHYAGILLVDHGGGVRHMLQYQLPGDGVYRQLDQSVREVSANTGACLMVSTKVFTQLGGFDESLGLVGNDIDFGLRCREAGLRNIWSPHCRLIHHESVSRSDRPTGADEARMWHKWGDTFRAGDPFFNPTLSQYRPDFLPAYLTEQSNELHAGQSAGDCATEPLPFGVNLIGYLRAEMGVGEAARGNAAALTAAGIPFGIIPYEKGNPSRMSNLAWQDKEIDAAVFSINLLHINADHLPAVMADLGMDMFRQRINIGYWAWELPEFPRRWHASFEHLDEVWVPSEFVRQAIGQDAPVPVVTIPHVISIARRLRNTLSRSCFGIPEGAFAFLTMFDTHSIAQRKNPFGAITAFKKAFSADDSRAVLVVKINNSNEDIYKELAASIAGFTNIVLISHPLQREEIDNLIALTDCYLSLHHSEGFGLGPAEAMALGKAVIATGWSGNMQYMTPASAIAINYELVSLGRDYGPYEAHQVWAKPDLEHAAQEMRTLVDDPARAHEIGVRARQHIAENFSAAAIGALMKERLSLHGRSLRIPAEPTAQVTLRARLFGQVHRILFAMRFLFRPFFPPLLRHRVRQYLLRQAQKRNSQ
jgi:GT2 family glycosyltransferase/glycosyltransferase involved in cell wall biosynthesis